MGRIILFMSVSLDGRFEDGQGGLAWQSVDEELHLHFNGVLRGMAAFLNGRVMHGMMAAYWPTADRDPTASQAVREYARLWRDMPKVVYSRTLKAADWNAEVADRVERAEVLALKARFRGDLALGGASLAASFAALDLIDEYRIYVHPVVLGRGRPLFGGRLLPGRLRLLETRAFGGGVVLLRYGRAGESPAP